MDNLGSIRPLHVVVICLVVMTVGGGSLLLSASEAPILVDGAVAWSEGSVLHAVVGLLCLNYEVATNHAGDVKNYILCLGAGLAILALSIAVVVRAPTEVPGSANGDDEASASANGNGGRAKRKAHVGPLFAAQLLVGLYLLWSFASSRWSSAPDLALGGSLLLGMYFLWSFALGHALGLEAARIASRLVLAIAVVTSLVAIWYYYGRNPNLRAKFPYGNPTFLAASLIPGMLLAISLICEKTLRAVRTRRVGPLGMAIVGLGAAVACLLACYLSGSRGAAVGLVFGVLGMAFFAVRGHARWIPAGLAIVVSLSGWVYYTGLAGSNEPAARSATIRTREFAWDYALRLFAQHPLRGYGQGGFVLAGDSFAPNDVLADPPALKTRLAHVHNEWLEVMADLGSIGITLIVVALALTLAAGGAALRILPSENLRWPLIGLLGALIGLVVEEMFGVGLRTAGVATAFYTVIGLIWAFSVRRTSRVGFVLATPGRRWMAGGVGCVVGLACLAIAHRDFMAARDSLVSVNRFTRTTSIERSAWPSERHSDSTRSGHWPTFSG